jgi:D-alanyl-D-alanine carboxypeptidase/D-alanyl-D-alanine-endopeptidase (penicillin-binding protein 4)
MRSSNRTTPLLLVLVLASGCSARPADPLLSPTVVGADARETRALQGDLATLFAAPALRRALVAVRVESLDHGDILFRHNDQRLVLPASNQKILTTAAAAEVLGWDYRFLTTLQPTGPVRNGVLEGDLVIVGSGDPTLSRRYEGADVVFARWADRLHDAGIRTIAGRLVGDAQAYSGELWGSGWAWDDLQNAFAAPVGALMVNDSVAPVVVAPGAAAGQPAAVRIGPDAGLSLEADVVTASTGVPAALRFERLPGAPVLRVIGSVGAGAPPIERAVAVVDPTMYFLATLRDALESRGILITGGIADADAAGAPAAPLQPALVEHYSPPLRDIAATTMRTSHNLHAESLLRATARHEALLASTAAARSVVSAVLEGWGVPADAIVIADGSGLSRYNYQTAAALMTVLRKMATDERHRDDWLASFPAGGGDGTLAARFVGGVAQGRVRAKSGSLRATRALSGYVRTGAGELLAFVMVVNNAPGPPQEVEGILDRAVERLVAYAGP